MARPEPPRTDAGPTAALDLRTGLPVVAMVGGGQLARMTHQAAIALGQSLRVLAALRRLADGATVVTFDHEHVPTEHLRALEADGVRVAPGPDALVHAQDKLVLRRRLAEAGEPQPRWAAVSSVAEVVAFADAGAGWPVVL